MLDTAFVCSSSVTHSRAVELTASNKCFLEKLAVTLLVKKNCRLFIMQNEGTLTLPPSQEPEPAIFYPDVQLISRVC
jgi:hypothetical protein